MYRIKSQERLLFFILNILSIHVKRFVLSANAPRDPSL